MKSHDPSHCVVSVLCEMYLMIKFEDCYERAAAQKWGSLLRFYPLSVVCLVDRSFWIL